MCDLITGHKIFLCNSLWNIYLYTSITLKKAGICIAESHILFGNFLTYLEHEWSCSWWEVDSLSNVILSVVSSHVVVDHDSLGCTLLSNQKHSFVLFGNCVYEEFCANIVHIWHKDAGVFWLMVSWVLIVGHLLTPVNPFAWKSIWKILSFYNYHWYI